MRYRFCPYCGSQLDNNEETQHQRRVESLLNLPADKEELPPLPSETTLNEGHGAVKLQHDIGYDSLSSIEQEIIDEDRQNS